jgi:hypothetical protein
MRWSWGLLSLSLTFACGDGVVDDEAHVLDDVDETGDGGGKADDPGLGGTGEVIKLTVEDGAVPGTPDRPNMVVYIPSGFDPERGLNLVVYLHGHYNCAANVIRARGTACRPGGGLRNAYSLARQLEDSKKNAILVVPELAYDAADSSEFAFADEDRFFWAMVETVGELGEKVGWLSFWDVNQIVVVSHSGGYRAAASIVTRGGATVNELWLLDSLYGREAEFDAWIQGEADLYGDARERRFANVYTRWGGSLALSQAMATRAAGWFGAGVVLDDRSGATLAPAQYDRGLLFKRSGLSHDDVPRYYFKSLLSTSAIPDRS